MDTLAMLLCGLLFTSLAHAVTFDVSFDATTRKDAATGRITVFLVKEGSTIKENTEPAGEYFFGDPQPIYGIDVKDLAPNEPARIDDSATSFPVQLSALPAGKYRAQAVLGHVSRKRRFPRRAGQSLLGGREVRRGF